MGKKTDRITLTISHADIEALRTLASRLGFVTQGGKMVGQGNISGLVEAIAQGRYRVVPSEAQVDASLKDSAQGLLESLAVTTLQPVLETYAEGVAMTLREILRQDDRRLEAFKALMEEGKVRNKSISQETEEDHVEP